MEAIYWVLTYACHRRCAHCYDDRFRPYVREELKAVIQQGHAAFRAIIEHLPDDMHHLVAAPLAKPTDTGAPI